MLVFAMRSMRPPAVVWLVLVIFTSITICALGATPMFADCSNINSNFTNSLGGDFEAISCNYPSTETTVSLGLGAGTTATAYIAYGKVAAGALASLSVLCPDAATSKSLSITVTGIAFGQDASFRFTGALPAHSSLHISNNTFYLTQQNRFTFFDPNTAGYYTTAILIGVSGTAIVLEEGTDLSAINNTVTCRWAGGGTDQEVAVAVIGASATLRSMSTLSMSGNSIIHSSFSSVAYVAYLYLLGSSSSSSLTLCNQSAIAMSGNSIINSSFSGNAYAAYMYLYSSSSSLALYNHSAIDMSGNSIINSSIGDKAYAVFMYLDSSGSSLTLCNYSAIAMSGNCIINGSISGNAYVAYMYLYSSSSSSSSLTLCNQSTIAMSGNSINNGSFSDKAYVAYLDIRVYTSSSSLTLYNHSAIAMIGNSIINGSLSGNVFVAYLYLYSSGSSLTLCNYSAIAMSGNSIIHSSFSSVAYVAYLYLLGSSSSSSLTLCNHSAIAMSGNCIINSSSSGNVYVAYMYLYSSSSSSSSSLTLYNQSAIAMTGNNNSQVRVSLVVIEVFGPILLKGMASIIVERNNAYISYGLFAVLRISARYISLNDSSSISTTGNRWQAPVLGRSSQLASLLTISSSRGSGASSVLSISGGSSLSVVLNDVIAGAMVLNVTMKVSAEFPSAIAIADNHVSEGYVSWLANFSGGFHLDGTFLATGNRVEAQIQITDFSFITIASTFTNGSMASVQACGNYLSWVGPILAPTLYLQPTPFASLAAKCTSSAGSVSPTIPMTHSISRDPHITSLTFSSDRSLLSHSNTSKLSSTQQTEESASPSIIVSQSRDVSITPGQPVAPSIAPKPVAVETAAKVRDVTGVFVAVTAVASITGGQLGVANAMLRLADCSASSDGSELPILVHPLRFSFGDRSYQRNAAGAVSDTLLVPLIVVAIALGPARLLIMWSRCVPSRAALVQMGWPTLLVLPFANLAEGIGATTVTALGSGEPFGVGMGVVALLVLLAFAGSWAWILARVVPRSRLQLVREESAAGLGKRRAFLRRMARPSHRWVPLAPAEGGDQRSISLADVERYGNAVGDKQWYYAELLSFLCSLAVGVCEGLPSSLCRERALIALVPSLLQCGLAVLALIPLERFLQSLLALCLVPMYVVVGVKVFSDSASDEQLDTVMAVLSTVGNVIGLVIMSLGLAVGLWEIATSHRAKRRLLSSRINPVSTPMIDIDEAVDTPEPEQLFAAGNPTYSSDETPPEQIANKKDPPSTTARTSRPIPQRPPLTMAEVLDYVEQVALAQRLEAELL